MGMIAFLPNQWAVGRRARRSDPHSGGTARETVRPLGCPAAVHATARPVRRRSSREPARGPGVRGPAFSFRKPARNIDGPETDFGQNYSGQFGHYRM
jgi:hypothetical protein